MLDYLDKQLVHLEDGTVAIKIEFFKGASKGENVHILRYSPLVAGEIENVRFRIS